MDLRNKKIAFLRHKLIIRLRNLIQGRKFIKAWKLHEEAMSCYEKDPMAALKLINEAIEVHPAPCWSELYAVRAALKRRLCDPTAEEDEEKGLKLLKEENPDYYKEVIRSPRTSS